MDSKSKKRSPAEIMVKNYLKEKNILCVYNFPVALYDEQKKLRIWYPDYFLPSLGLYLEVCGTERDKNEKYRRERVYEENQIPILFIHYWKEIYTWKGWLENEIFRIENNRFVKAEKLKEL